MVDDVLVNTLALLFGGGGAEALGNYAESKIKPGVLVTSTNQDKLIAEVANNGPKLVFAYGIYSVGKRSPFIKSVAMGAVLSAIFDVGWRYTHQGAPYSAYVEVPVQTPTETSTPTGTSTPTTPTTNSTSSGESPGEPDIGLLDSYFISDTDTLEYIMAKARILEEM